MKLALFVICLFCSLAFGQAQGDEQLQDYVKIKYSFKMPEGHGVHEWETYFNKLNNDCGLNSRAMLLDRLTAKDGKKSADHFITYVPLTKDTTLETFEKGCKAAFNKHKGDLRAWGNVKINSFEIAQFPATCASTCGVDPCPACPLLAICNTDAECGLGAVCKDSQQYKGQKWCVSPAASISTVVAIAMALILGMIMF